jgi:hypothetical protein
MMEPGGSVRKPPLRWPLSRFVNKARPQEGSTEAEEGRGLDFALVRLRVPKRLPKGRTASSSTGVIQPFVSPALVPTVWVMAHILVPPVWKSHPQSLKGVPHHRTILCGRTGRSQ